MNLSLNTHDNKDAASFLKIAADVGFTHIHWCYHWCTDFFYMDSEIAQIEKWFKEYGLKLMDLHGSVGPEKNWFSEKEYERLAGVELVKNRMEMTARLGGEAVVMHIPEGPISDNLKKSLETLEPISRKLGVKIAVENGDFVAMNSALSTFGPEFLGLCYDCGHGNMIPDGLDQLEKLKDRLISIHLHDNNGIDDQHKIPFTGTVDWQRLMNIIGKSSYTKCINLEVLMVLMDMDDDREFITMAYEKAAILGNMLEKARKETHT